MGYVRKFLRRLLTDKSEPREVVQVLSDKEWDEVTRVAMGFEESLGVSPEYSRSYTMVFTPKDVEIMVMSPYVGLLATYVQAISNQKLQTRCKTKTLIVLIQHQKKVLVYIYHSLFPIT